MYVEEREPAIASALGHGAANADRERISMDLAEARRRVRALEAQLGEVDATDHLSSRLRWLEAAHLGEKTRNELLHMCLDSIGEGIVVTDTRLRFLVFNPAAERIVGRGATTVPPDQWHAEYGTFRADSCTPIPPHELPLVRALNGQSFDHVEVFIRNEARPEGVWISCKGRPLRDDGDRVVGAIVSFEDITEVRRTRLLLQRFYAAAEQSTSLLVVLDAHGVVEYVNPCICSTLQWSPQTLLGKAVWEISELDRDEVGRVWNILRTEGAFRGHTFAHRRDGTRVLLTGAVAPVRDDHDFITHWMALFSDTTEQQRAEEDLKRSAADLARSNADLQQFAYIVSHDLQEPLRMVSGFLDILRKRHGASLDADATRLVEYAMEGARGMHQLIRDLLEYARVDIASRGIEPCDANVAFESALVNLGSRIEESDADVRSSRLPKVRVDTVQLVQVFQNLVGNAIKFGRQRVRPRVRVAAKRTNGAWVFSVKDNGIGIEPSQQGRIFTIFQRLHPRSQYPGTGIGLAITKKIIERHGGRVWVESTLGRGSTFYFTLPAA